MAHTGTTANNRRDFIVSTRNLSKTYYTPEGKVCVLRSVEMDIKRDSIAIQGPSGCGKSTLINVLSALDTPDPGSKVWFDGKLVRFDRTREVADLRRKVGLVFQSYNLIAHLSALDNVAVVLATQGWNWGIARSAAHKQLAEVGLAERAAFKPHQLSGGQQQRVGIARALVGSPKLVVADEPTGNLDFESAEQVMRLLNKCAVVMGIPVLIVTHDKNIASRYCNQILQWRNGQFIEVRRSPRRSVDRHVAATRSVAGCK